MGFPGLFRVGRIGFVISGVSFFSLCWIDRIRIVVSHVFDLFFFVCSYLFSCLRGWEVIFIDLCVVLINLWDSFSQVWPSVGPIVAQGVPVIAVGVEMFVYSFALLGSPDFVFTESEECITSSVGWIVFIDFLNSAVGLRKVETS